MKILLDTYVYLWWLRDDRKLTRRLAETLADPTHTILVSAATVWEASIKIALGRLHVEGDLVAEIEANGFVELPVNARHAQLAGALPRHHEDPFDRLLVAQASLEGLRLATVDSAFRHYDVALV